MRVEYRLRGSIRREEFPEADALYESVTIPISREDLHPVIAHMATLQSGLCKQVHLISGGTSVSISSGDRPTAWSRPEGLAITLPEAEMGAVMSFLLVYSRDGAADVDHIDIEAEADSSDFFEVTFKVDRAKSPLSAEEATRLIGESD